MDAHACWHMETIAGHNCNAWERMPANGNAVAEAGFKVKTLSLNWSEQEAFHDDSRDHIITTRTPCSKSA